MSVHDISLLAPQTYFATRIRDGKESPSFALQLPRDELRLENFHGWLSTSHFAEMRTWRSELRLVNGKVVRVVTKVEWDF